MNSRPNCCQKDNSYLLNIIDIGQISTICLDICSRTCLVLVLGLSGLFFEVVLALVCHELPLVEVKAPFILSSS